MKIHFIRHATMILYYNDTKILIDPILCPKGTASAIQGVPNKADNPLTDLPVGVGPTMNCDAVLITHTHRDHFDDMAQKLLPKNLPVFCQPEDEDKLKGLGFSNASAVEASLEWGNIRINRTKGKHGHGVIALKMAPVSGFVISSPGEPTIYIAGDTVWCPCVEKALEKYKPEIVVCNCGGARFSRGKAITMDLQDILSVCGKAPSAKVVAVHMDAWNHCRVSRKDLREFIGTNNMNRQVLVPDDGEFLEF